MKRWMCLMTVAAVTLGAAPAFAAENPFVGRWALTIPGGGAGWLGVTQENGYLDASILWGGGSVVPVSSAFLNDDTLIVTRTRKVERKDKDGKVVRTHTFTEVLMGKVQGDSIQLHQIKTSDKGAENFDLSGTRIAPLPPAPDLSKLRYGKAVKLFNGKNLDGWKLTNENQKSGWSVEGGLLINDPAQKKDSHVRYGNLRTVDEFKDFNLALEVKVGEKGNSGIYLRGIYEVQISDSYGKGLDSHNMGAVYSRITPTVAAEKPAGQWQRVDITLADRHVTVVLNGKRIIDNQPLLGCTGGALSSDETKAGPIFLQGDHSAITYRNIVLKPILK